MAAGPELAAAVTDAGGLGVIGGVGYTPEFLKKQIGVSPFPPILFFFSFFFSFFFFFFFCLFLFRQFCGSLLCISYFFFFSRSSKSV